MASNCTEAELKSAVISKVIPSYISKKKLADSWNGATLEKVSRKQFKGQLEWVFLFKNPKEIESKQNLYVFMTEKGGLSGINHTGK